MENPSGTPSTLLGDRAKVRQIVTNVVGNAREFRLFSDISSIVCSPSILAVKHTKEGGILIEWGEQVDSNIQDAFNEKKDSIRIGISV